MLPLDDSMYENGYVHFVHQDVSGNIWCGPFQVHPHTVHFLGPSFLLSNLNAVVEKGVVAPKHPSHPPF